MATTHTTYLDKAVAVPNYRATELVTVELTATAAAPLVSGDSYSIFSTGKKIIAGALEIVTVDAGGGKIQLTDGTTELFAAAVMTPVGILPLTNLPELTVGVLNAVISVADLTTAKVRFHFWLVD